MSDLAALNQLELLDNGVWGKGENEGGIAYSDGDPEEEYILCAVSSAKDLTSLSTELHSFERDWSSECHLSSKRANVFRGLDFSGIENVLEIGSGCGAITRFLGEQGGQVDAVEGSLRRAEITRLRCHDLPNVSVIHSDFNALELPEKHYDLALLTGVLEYAGKYGTPGCSPEEAALVMLQSILDSLGQHGKLIVAIENRVGFKYLSGASEDHFSRPWVGICDYPDCKDPAYEVKQGIKTWDRASWQKMLKHLPDVSCQWYYPFPDYKLATTLLSEHFIQNAQYVSSCLSRVQSRDYTAIWQPLIDEPFFWQTAAAAGIVEEMANSFVLVIEKNENTPSDFVPFDFVHFSGQARKPVYRTMVFKKKGIPQVERLPLFDLPAPAEDSFITQHLETESFYDGELLITQWLRTLKTCSAPATLDALLKRYYAYLLEQCQVTPPERLLDLLPMNIVISEDGNWAHFDQEWHAQDSITPPFILFRAVLYLFWDNKTVLLQFCKEQNLKTGWQFVEYCLGRILYTSEINIPNFIKIEDKIQQDVSLEGMFASIEQLLDTAAESRPQEWSWEKTSLIWGESGTQSSPPVSIQETDLGLTIHFNLPTDICNSPFFQFHMVLPESDIGVMFALRGVTFFGVSEDGAKTCVFPVDNTTSSPPLMQLTNITYYENIRGGVYGVIDKEPQILHFAFPGDIDCEHYAALECQITLEFLSITLEEAKKEQYKLEKQQLDVALAQSTNLVAEKTDEVIFRDKLITEKNDEIHALFALAEERKHRLQEIEESKAWRIILKLRRITTKIQSLIGRETSHSCQKCTINDDSRHSPQKEENIVALPDIQQLTKERRERDCFDDIERKKDSLKSVYPPELNKPIISVIIATFNTLPVYLQETLDTVLAQSYTHWEIIIVDNGSSNGTTLDFLKKINHPKIKIHFNIGLENLTQAMDAGVLLASGDWVLFVGHHDRLKPDALTVLSQYILEKENGLLFWDEAIIDRSGVIVNHCTKQQLDTKQPPSYDIVGHSLCVRQTLILQAGGLDSEFDGVQLFELALRAHAHNKNIVYVNKVLSETRQFEPPSAGDQHRLQDLRSRAWEKNVSRQ